MLLEVGERISGVAQSWADAVSQSKTRGDSFTSAVELSDELALGVELIREGWLLHRGQSRVAFKADTNLALLMGDWCYAAGLRIVTEHGTLEHVRVLANLISSVSANYLADSSELEVMWQGALSDLL